METIRASCEFGSDANTPLVVLNVGADGTQVFGGIGVVEATGYHGFDISFASAVRTGTTVAWKFTGTDSETGEIAEIDVTIDESGGSNADPYDNLINPLVSMKVGPFGSINPSAVEFSADKMVKVYGWLYSAA